MLMSKLAALFSKYRKTWFSTTVKYVIKDDLLV